MIYVYIFIGGGLGSIARYITGKGASILFPTEFPVGTLAANLLACAILAVITVVYSKSSQLNWIEPMILIGFCGGYSTFSTFGNETVKLMDSGNYLFAVLNVIISVVTAIGIIYLIRSKA